MSSGNDDGQQNFIVGFLFALIALVLFLVIGVAIRQVHGKPGANEALAEVAKGVPGDKTDLQKPAGSTGAGSHAQARRVEVELMQ